MSAINLTCPMCFRDVTVDESAFHAPEGKVAILACPKCHNRHPVSDFQAARHRQDRETKKRREKAYGVIRKAEKAEQLRREREESDRQRKVNEKAKQEALEKQAREQAAAALRQREELHTAQDQEKHRLEQLEAGRSLNDRDIELIQKAIKEGVRSAHVGYNREWSGALTGLLAIFGGVLVLVSGATFASRPSRRFWSSFDSSNAIGATANRLEELLRDNYILNALLMLIAALLIFVIVALRRNRPR